MTNKSPTHLNSQLKEAVQILELGGLRVIALTEIESAITLVEKVLKNSTRLNKINEADLHKLLKWLHSAKEGGG